MTIENICLVISVSFYHIQNTIYIWEMKAYFKVHSSQTIYEGIMRKEKLMEMLNCKIV